MKTYLPVILLTAWIAFPATADDKISGTQSTPMPSANMVPAHNTDSMLPRIQEMSLLMSQIANEKNLEKRDALMKKHMEKMQENMLLMDQTMPMNRPGSESHKMHKAANNERMQMMEGRVDMMQAMMNQMMEHTAQREIHAK